MTILITLTTIALVICIYLLYRNQKVYNFQRKLIEICFLYNVHNQVPSYSSSSAWKWFLEKHSYEKMVFSIKPLTLEAWFTQEEIDEILLKREENDEQE